MAIPKSNWIAVVEDKWSYNPPQWTVSDSDFLESHLAGWRKGYKRFVLIDTGRFVAIHTGFWLFFIHKDLIDGK